MLLPPGRLVHCDYGKGRPVLWMSDGLVKAGVWARLCSSSEDLGLWPLLLEALEPDDEFRPWGSGELSSDRTSDPKSQDANKVLARWWRDCAADEDDDSDDERAMAGRPAVTAPYGRRWPGLAPSAPTTTSPAQRAMDYADELLAGDPSLRLGLVPAATSAEALSGCGWEGPMNHTNDTGEIAAVVLDWERRFGARVVGVGFASLYLSVATPPTTLEDALRVAAEHFAFCPDNVWQGLRPNTLASYAEQLVGETSWTFWWD